MPSPVPRSGEACTCGVITYEGDNAASYRVAPSYQHGKCPVHGNSDTPEEQRSETASPPAEETCTRLMKSLVKKLPFIAPEELESQVYGYLGSAWIRGAQDAEMREATQRGESPSAQRAALDAKFIEGWREGVSDALDAIDQGGPNTRSYAYGQIEKLLAGSPPWASTTSAADVCPSVDAPRDVAPAPLADRDAGESASLLATAVRSFLDFAAFEQLDMGDERNARLYEAACALRSVADDAHHGDRPNAEFEVRMPLAAHHRLVRERDAVIETLVRLGHLEAVRRIVSSDCAGNLSQTEPLVKDDGSGLASDGDDRNEDHQRAADDRVAEAARSSGADDSWKDRDYCRRWLEQNTDASADVGQSLHLARLLAEVRAEAREACAKALQPLVNDHPDAQKEHGIVMWNAAVQNAMVIVRARTTHPKVRR